MHYFTQIFIRLVGGFPLFTRLPRRGLLGNLASGGEDSPGNLGIKTLSSIPAGWLLFILALAQFSVEQEERLVLLAAHL
jgi:hypothetical protein